METYENLVDALNALRKEGYTEDFNLQQNCLCCREGKLKVYHDEFKVDKVFRFDANTDPNDESILYAISSEKHSIKGLLVNGYGISADSATSEMLELLIV